MDISFIPAKSDEARELSELRRQVWQTTYQGIYPDDMIDHFDYAFHNKRDLMCIQSQQFLVYFITENMEKIGYLILKKDDPLRLQSLYLLKQHRGKGIGSLAFVFVREHCWEQGIKEFCLDCHPDNTGALEFYEKMGGVITGHDLGHERNEENGVKISFVV